MSTPLLATAPKAQSYRKPQLTLSLFLGMLVVVILGAVYWLFAPNSSLTQADMEENLLVLLQPQEVPRHLPLLVLADYPIEQVWQEPLEQKEGHAAFAIWLFSPLRDDQRSIQELRTLAVAQQEEAPEVAASYLFAAADVVRLTPELTDRERAEQLIEIGKILQTLGLPAQAVTEWRQVSILARYAPSMPSFYRATLFHTLVSLYNQVGAERLEALVLQHAAQVGNASGEIIVPERVILETQASLNEPTELQVAREQRRLAAAEAARHPDDEADNAELRDALKAEGLFHRLWITEELKKGHPRAHQAALLVAHINWLQRERMLAWGVGGDSFREWIDRRGEIEQALHDAWSSLESVRLEQSLLEGIPERATLAQRDWWATHLVQARLARDPYLNIKDIIVSMTPNNADGAGKEQLRLDWIQGRFWRIPRDYVGTDKLPE